MRLTTIYNEPKQTIFDSGGVGLLQVSYCSNERITWYIVDEGQGWKVLIGHGSSIHQSPSNPLNLVPIMVSHKILTSKQKNEVDKSIYY